MQLAFYKANSTFTDKIIGWATKSPYTHVELVVEPIPYIEHLDRTEYRYLCIGSSGRDGGVREKIIDLDSEKWEIVDCPWINETHLMLLKIQLGKKYDMKGIIFSQMLSLSRHKKNRWFCSELIAWGLKLNNPQRVSPGDLYGLVKWMNEAVGNAEYIKSPLY